MSCIKMSSVKLSDWDEKLKKPKKIRWYLGGVSGAAAAIFTHPLDMLKVHRQTQDFTVKISLLEMVQNIRRDEGIMSLYNGISASLLRQLTYATTRMGIYEVGKTYVNTNTFTMKMYLAAFGGIIGGIVGVPTDLVNVRMQNDIKLPPNSRRKHVFDGLARICREEGFAHLFTGGYMAITRGMLMTIGQSAVYDQVKATLLVNHNFRDNVYTTIEAALIAAGVATVLTSPLDVLKTHSMTAKPGEFQGIWQDVRDIVKRNPMGFFKGLLPAFARLGPQTVLQFVFLEQLRGRG